MRGHGRPHQSPSRTARGEALLSSDVQRVRRGRDELREGHGERPREGRCARLAREDGAHAGGVFGDHGGRLQQVAQCRARRGPRPHERVSMTAECLCLFHFGLTERCLLQWSGLGRTKGKTPSRKPRKLRFFSICFF